MKIKIKCKGNAVLSIDQISEFQGKIKYISDENIEKLKKSILKLGFIAPLFIWNDGTENKLLDGHQRLKALQILKKEKHEIPDIPIVIISAKTENEAKTMLLSITSQYGEFNITELQEFLEGIEGTTLDFLRLVDNEVISGDIGEIDFSDLDELNESLEGKEDISLRIEFPIKYKEKVIDILANGEKKPTAPILGKGLLKLCGLL